MEAIIIGNCLCVEEGTENVVVAHINRRCWDEKYYWCSNIHARYGRKYFDNSQDALKAAARTLGYKIRKV